MCFLIVRQHSKFISMWTSTFTTKYLRCCSLDTICDIKLLSVLFCLRSVSQPGKILGLYKMALYVREGMIICLSFLLLP